MRLDYSAIPSSRGWKSQRAGRALWNGLCTAALPVSSAQSACVENFQKRPADALSSELICVAPIILLTFGIQRSTCNIFALRVLLFFIMEPTTIVWFRLDLRLSDNPALTAAAARGGGIVPVFIWAPEEEGAWPPGAASRWWLHQSLKALDSDLCKLGMRLILRRGPSLEALRSLIHECGADAVFWNRRYEPSLRNRDEGVQRRLQPDGIHIEHFNSALLVEPDSIKNQRGNPFLVFTPFWKGCLSAMPGFLPEPVPVIRKTLSPTSLELADLHLEPEINWTEGLRKEWQPGEAGAQKALQRFVKNALEDYSEHRDFPAISGTCRLSPHLHFGEISPRQIWSACYPRRDAASRAYLRQLGWREFAHYLLHHFPETPDSPLRPNFSKFPWREDPSKLHAWQRGWTGFPLIDAGMRELWETGWMHNRARMVAASFLVKDLLLSWTEGARWFWDTLVDADLANNTLGWQWVAGCGADAAPYFRIFNPSVQQTRFDPSEEYIRRWVPELDTPEYPAPIVDHEIARERALEALADMKKRGTAG
jgi:deoxyribodipyrimidine photo-lyase